MVVIGSVSPRYGAYRDPAGPRLHVYLLFSLVFLINTSKHVKDAYGVCIALDILSIGQILFVNLSINLSVCLSIYSPVPGLKLPTLPCGVEVLPQTTYWSQN